MTPPTLVCFSSLRWDHPVDHRQQLLTRASLSRRILFVEEAVFLESTQPHLRVEHRGATLTVASPELPKQIRHRDIDETIEALLEDHFFQIGLQRYDFWYESPQAVRFSRNFLPEIKICDCIDHKADSEEEFELLSTADLIFTSDAGLTAEKFRRYGNVYSFSVDADTKVDQQTWDRAWAEIAILLDEMRDDASSVAPSQEIRPAA